MTLLRRPLLGASLLLALAASEAASLTGRVAAVADGDTLLLLDGGGRQHAIRLAGIDAPEKSQPFGERATAHLDALARGREASADCRRRERSGRVVCVVRADGRDLGLEQLTAGMAWLDRRDAGTPPGEALAGYEQAEFFAKARRQGLWADKNPVPPWQWRGALRWQDEGRGGDR